MEIKTSVRQDAELINVILRRCSKSSRVSRDFLPLQIKGAASILDGRPLTDERTYNEKLRSKRFSLFCNLIVDYLVLMRMVTTVTEMLDNCGHPTDFYFLRITNIGRIF